MYITPVSAKIVSTTTIRSTILAKDFMNAIDFIAINAVANQHTWVRKSHLAKKSETPAIISMIPSINTTIELLKFGSVFKGCDKAYARRAYKEKGSF